jgi:Uma2 family endonuclease
MAIGASLLTAEEYMALPDAFDGPTELVKGVLVTMPPPRPRHGQLCARVSFLIQQYLHEHDIGQVLTNDAGTVTERSPDTVRGPDVSYYSYERVPKGPLSDGLLAVSPEIALEVRSPSDRWSELHIKVGEYLRAGVLVVCILDDDAKSVHMYFADREPQILKVDDDFSLPEILGDFRVPVQRFFD